MTKKQIRKPGELERALLNAQPAGYPARAAREIAEVAGVSPHLARVRLAQLVREGKFMRQTVTATGSRKAIAQFYRYAVLLLAVLGASCGREATAPAFECTPLAVSAADTIPAALIPQVVVCVEAK